MANDDVYLAAGKLIVFSVGEYSDYGYRGMYVTLRPLLKSELCEIMDQTQNEWMRLDTERDREWERWHQIGGEEPTTSVPDKHELYQTNLIKAGLLMIIDYQEIHIGSYRELELAF